MTVRTVFCNHVDDPAFLALFSYMHVSESSQFNWAAHPSFRPHQPRPVDVVQNHQPRSPAPINPACVGTPPPPVPTPTRAHWRLPRPTPRRQFLARRCHQRRCASGPEPLPPQQRAGRVGPCTGLRPRCRFRRRGLRLLGLHFPTCRPSAAPASASAAPAPALRVASSLRAATATADAPRPRR